MSYIVYIVNEFPNPLFYINYGLMKGLLEWDVTCMLQMIQVVECIL